MEVLSRGRGCADGGISGGLSSWAVWAAGGALLWTAGYGGLKLYWALGGIGLRDTVGFPAEAWSDPGFVLLGLWGTVGLALGGGVVALGLVSPWGRRVPR